MRSRLRFAIPCAAALLIGPGSSCTRLDDPAATGTGPYAVREQAYVWYDVSRLRPLPVRIYAPDSDGGPFPLLVFSPGTGNSRDHYTFLGRHWAGQGYVAVFVTHPETDEDVIYGEQRPALIVLQAVYEAVQQISLRWDRPLDVSFALDQVAADPKLSAQVDWNRVGVAGHSLGAYTALQLIGMQVAGLPAAHAELADARVKAVVALSPPGPGSLGLDEQSWDAITMPCMTIAGTLDVDPVTHSPTLRKMVFERSPGPDQYFVTLENATHGTFDDRSPWALDRLLHPQYAAYIADASTAFLNAYLRGDGAAQADLLDGSLERDSDGVCTVEFKNVTLIDGGD
ncbi:MAG TPA: hypothetical protein PLP66_15780 [Phycisphaerae bacterium]|nr:hypothetical protein [Phycisphaerae bacterium]HPM25369.1 hypothetical protein [Phycisphaerae bacterium]